MSIRNKGFTLIELLIVVLLISVLTGVTVAYLNSSGLRAKTRDSQRIADLRKIQTALELYYADNRQYPTSLLWNRASVILATPLEGGGYISKVPTDPSNNLLGQPCDLNGHGYLYRTNPTSTIYFLVTHMEISSSDDSSLCSSLNQWGTYGCTPVPADVYCYGVQNP